VLPIAWATCSAFGATSDGLGGAGSEIMADHVPLNRAKLDGARVAEIVAECVNRIGRTRSTICSIVTPFAINASVQPSSRARCQQFERATLVGLLADALAVPLRERSKQAKPFLSQ
jgi:hypothetical protein